MRSDTELMLALIAYAMAAVSTILVAYLAWRKIRPRRHDYRYHRTGTSIRKRWGLNDSGVGDSLNSSASLDLPRGLLLARSVRRAALDRAQFQLQ